MGAFCWWMDARARTERRGSESKGAQRFGERFLAACGMLYGPTNRRSLRFAPEMTKGGRWGIRGFRVESFSVKTEMRSWVVGVNL